MYTQEYPAYYEVSNSFEHLDGFYERLPEDQKYEDFPVFKKRSTEGVIEYFLYLHTNGYWTIAVGTSSLGGWATSSPKGLPTPELSEDWEVWNNGWKASNDFTLLPINPVYPESYTVSYSGHDQEIIGKLQGALGNYTKQENGQDDIPMYKNLETESTMFLSQNGKWILQNSYKIYHYIN